jgi:hypothetical protein
MFRAIREEKVVKKLKRASHTARIAASQVLRNGQDGGSGHYSQQHL